MLDVEQLSAGYGDTRILSDVSLKVEDGEVVALLGRNGAGKSTLLKAIVGAVKLWGGTVRLSGTPVSHQPVYRIAGQGVCLVPEDRRIFSNLSVEENLRLAVRARSQWQLADVYDLFPRLQERRKNKGDRLSGGEQQMVAIGRALVNAPRILLLDEPMEGLAPVIVDEIMAAIHRIKEKGVSILLVEQSLDVCTQLSGRHYVMEMGQIVRSGQSRDIEDNRASYEQLLGVDV